MLMWLPWGADENVAALHGGNHAHVLRSMVMPPMLSTAP
jgi:hypothetical protein